MLGIIVWHGLAAFSHTGTWRDISTVLLALVLAGVVLVLNAAD